MIESISTQTKWLKDGRELSEIYNNLSDSFRLPLNFEQVQLKNCEHGQKIRVPALQIVTSQPEVAYPILINKLNGQSPSSTLVGIPVQLIGQSGNYYLLRDGNHTFVTSLLKGASSFDIKLENPFDYIRFCGREEIDSAVGHLSSFKGALPRLVKNFTN